MRKSNLGVSAKPPRGALTEEAWKWIKRIKETKKKFLLLERRLAEQYMVVTRSGMDTSHEGVMTEFGEGSHTTRGSLILLPLLLQGEGGMLLHLLH